MRRPHLSSVQRGERRHVTSQGLSRQMDKQGRGPKVRMCINVQGAEKLV